MVNPEVLDSLKRLLKIIEELFEVIRKYEAIVKELGGEK